MQEIGFRPIWQAPFSIFSQVVGVILAGGNSTRMGRDKSALDSPGLPLERVAEEPHLGEARSMGVAIPGETWLGRQLRLLTAAGIQDRRVAWHSVRPPPILPAGVGLVRDRISDLGPLAALDSALAALDARFLLVIPVDLQRATPGLLRDLLARVRPGCGVVPWVGGRYEPLLAIYPASARGEATRRVENRQLSMRGLVEAGLADGWLERWAVPELRVPEFANWNSPSDITTAMNDPG